VQVLLNQAPTARGNISLTDISKGKKFTNNIMFLVLKESHDSLQRK